MKKFNRVNMMMNDETCAVVKTDNGYTVAACKGVTNDNSTGYDHITWVEDGAIIAHRYSEIKYEMLGF